MVVFIGGCNTIQILCMHGLITVAVFMGGHLTNVVLDK